MHRSLSVKKSKRSIVEEVSGYAGDEVTVNINVNNNPGICAAGVTVSYDGNTLELKSVTNGSVLGGNIFGPVSNNPIKLTWSTTENSTANGVLATLTFTVKENADSGKSAITLTYDPDEVYNIDMRMPNPKGKRLGGLRSQPTIFPLFSIDIIRNIKRAKSTRKSFQGSVPCLIRRFINTFGLLRVKVLGRCENERCNLCSLLRQ